MIAKIHSAIPYGFDGKLVEVEGDLSQGLPAFNIVGMANRTINEARERVRSAIKSSGFAFPSYKMTINLAPADLLKDGSYLDLPIALSVLVLSSQLLQTDVAGRFFVGELSLDGRLRPVRGIVNIVEEAKKSGARAIYVPIQNLPQAKIVKGLPIYGVETLKSLFLSLKNQTLANTHETPETGLKTAPSAPESPLLDQVRGQALAKRALTIAIAGHHNMLISGPPGAGKSLLAKVAANLLPPLTPDEQVAVTKIYSLSGLNTEEIITKRPFRSPHHTASINSIIGGGSHATPGEITLAHNGILFLDELPEYDRAVLEALRQPLEDKVITISRLNQKVTYPANFMLIAAMNPCPCGYYGDKNHSCTCTTRQIQNYNKKLSGPLLDRIDLLLGVEKVKNTELIEPPKTDTNEHFIVKNTISKALERQRERYAHIKPSDFYNSSLSSFEITKFLTLEPAAANLLKTASSSLNLSARAYFKTIKVARTIADLDDAPTIKKSHVAEALSFRQNPLYFP